MDMFGFVSDRFNMDEQDPSRTLIEFKCTKIAIGNYVYTPTQKVSVYSESIDIIAPHLHDASIDVVLRIRPKEIVKILLFSGDHPFPMMFIYTMSKVGDYIRNELGMTENSDPYYMPKTSIEPHKRITLFPEAVTAHMQTVFRTLFQAKIDNLCYLEAVLLYAKTGIKQINNCESGSESPNQAESTSQNNSLHAVDTTLSSRFNVTENNQGNIAISDVQHEPNSSINSLMYKRNNSIPTAESDGSKRVRADSNHDSTNGTVNAEESRPDSVSHVTAPVIDELFVAVTTEPYQDLTLEQATEIRKSLERKLKDDLLCAATSAETSKVRFRDHAHFCDGVLRIQCENHDALAWIREAITFIPAPISHTTLVVKPQADLQRILCRLFVPDDDNTEIDSLIRLLDTQNTAVDVNSWYFIRGERCTENEMQGVRLYFRVPRKDVDTLRAQQRRLYWLMGNIYIKIGALKEEQVEQVTDAVNNREDIDFSIKQEEIAEHDYHGNQELVQNLIQELIPEPELILARRVNNTDTVRLN